ncbi:MAG: hypothetical protein ACJ78Q_20675 [Chloroflexia bacterium]
MLDYGKKLSAASFRVFCTPDELLEWVKTLCKEKDRGCITFTSSAKYGIIQSSRDKIVLYDDIFSRMFLYSSTAQPSNSLTMNDVQSRAWGWVDIEPGRLREGDTTKVLTFTTIVGEDFENEPVHPAKYVRWLKGRLKDKRKCGVVGKHVTLGDPFYYHDICYTPNALQLYKAGVTWKQDPTYNVIFEPPTDDGQ